MAKWFSKSDSEEMNNLVKARTTVKPVNPLAQKQERQEKEQKALSSDDLPEGEQPKNPATKEAMQVKPPVVFAEHEEKAEKAKTNEGKKIDPKKVSSALNAVKKVGWTKLDSTQQKLLLDHTTEKAHIGFDKLKNKLAHKPGITNPAAVAAAIGRKKYGRKGMAAMAAAGKKSHQEEVTWFKKSDEKAMNQRLPGKQVEELKKSLDREIEKAKREPGDAKRQMDHLDASPFKSTHDIDTGKHGYAMMKKPRSTEGLAGKIQFGNVVRALGARADYAKKHGLQHHVTEDDERVHSSFWKPRAK